MRTKRNGSSTFDMSFRHRQLIVWRSTKVNSSRSSFRTHTRSKKAQSCGLSRPHISSQGSDMKCGFIVITVCFLAFAAASPVLAAEPQLANDKLCFHPYG